MSRFLKPCLDCGTLSRGSRCDVHEGLMKAKRDAARDTPERREKKRNLYNSHYRKERAALVEWVRQNGATCYLCNKQLGIDDRVEADHVIASDPNSPLLPVHRLCNQRRGNKPLP
jgi:uncharacterized Fe-S cluster-containing protein